MEARANVIFPSMDKAGGRDGSYVIRSISLGGILQLVTEGSLSLKALSSRVNLKEPADECHPRDSDAT